MHFHFIKLYPVNVNSCTNQAAGLLWAGARANVIKYVEIMILVLVRPTAKYFDFLSHGENHKHFYSRPKF